MQNEIRILQLEIRSYSVSPCIWQHKEAQSNCHNYYHYRWNNILSGLALNYGHFSCVITSPHLKRWFSYASFVGGWKRHRGFAQNLCYILNSQGSPLLDTLEVSFSTYIYYFGVSMYQNWGFWLSPCIQSFSLLGNRWVTLKDEYPNLAT